MAAETATLTAVPHSLEAERAVLGAVLIDNQMLNRVVPILASDDFYRESHRRIFRAMEQMSMVSRIIDLVTLQDTLGSMGDLEMSGGLPYIASLIDGVPKSVNAEHHARIVKEKSILRKLMSETARISLIAGRAQDPVDEVLDEAERAIFSLADDRFRSGFIPIQQAVRDAHQLIERLTERKDLITGVPTGFADLDEASLSGGEKDRSLEDEYPWKSPGPPVLRWW